MSSPLPQPKEERLPPSVVVQRGQHRLRYWTPNKMCLWRAKTLATKEPSTIGWLDSLELDAPLLDVGANFAWFCLRWCSEQPDRTAVAWEADLRSAAVARLVLESNAAATANCARWRRRSRRCPDKATTRATTCS